ncbi:hypothetical protein [Nocardiopsis protaetiae]|uniref:hypothetical protein n=1 Tax=Nocardiopsis protaetiae TaxID=3382270 RepID=UPI00387B79D3
MYAQQPPPPRVHPSELRPGRGGYWAGGLAIVLGGITGIALFVHFLVQAVALPTFTAELESPGSLEFEYRTAGRPELLTLYSTSASASPEDCLLITPSGSYTGFGHPGYSHESTTWSLVGDTLLGERGDYTLTCEGDPGASYAIAVVPDDGAMAQGIVGALASFFLIPLGGLVLGLILIIGTAVRRNNHKRRLLAERAGYPYRH